MGVCACVWVGVLDGEREKEFAHMQGHMYINCKRLFTVSQCAFKHACMRARVAMSLTAAAAIGSDRAVSVSHSR